MLGFVWLAAFQPSAALPCTVCDDTSKLNGPAASRDWVDTRVWHCDKPGAGQNPIETSRAGRTPPATAKTLQPSHLLPNKNISKKLQGWQLCKPLAIKWVRHVSRLALLRLLYHAAAEFGNQQRCPDRDILTLQLASRDIATGRVWCIPHNHMLAMCFPQYLTRGTGANR